MLLIDGDVVWSASDLTAAAGCEYAVLRRLDVLLSRTPAPEVADDPLLAQIATLGDQHEQSVLAELRGDTGGPARRVVELPRLRGVHSRDTLADLDAVTVKAFADEPDFVAQAGFFDGRFFGYADFVERTDAGWRVSDAKLARQARPSALLQLAAYAEQVRRMGLPLAPTATLLLGSGTQESFRLTDVMPVFADRRARLLHILDTHRDDPGPLAWADERFGACGRCPACTAAIEASQDLLLVAGLRLDQRKKLRDLGLRTVADLAAATVPPDGLSATTFTNLTAQARLQAQQLAAGLDDDGQPVLVLSELTDSAEHVLATLPPPSAGDIFFDFEGDPLYNRGAPGAWGLEYLWGVLEAPVDGAAEGAFVPRWADDPDAEREAFIGFMGYLMERLRTHPDLHVYHYAPYEKTALLRLARQHHRYEAELDALLRDGVLVDLYAVVRGAVRISQPSYSIKKLEPLYMPRRTGTEVAAGDASIVVYHEYRAFLEQGRDADAAHRWAELQEYNRLDCVSTRLLYEWLLHRVPAGGGAGARPAEPETVASEAEPDLVFDRLMALAGPALRAERTAEQQAFAMLAEARDYYRRENAPFWWAHFDRLRVPVDRWDHERDVFRVDGLDGGDGVGGVEVESGWERPEGGRSNALERRTLRLTGDWTPGSTPGSRMYPVYGPPLPVGVKVGTNCLLGTGKETDVEVDADDERRVTLTEACAPGTIGPSLPIALVPSGPPSPKSIVEAIAAVTARAADGELPDSAVTDILCRRPPRLTGGGRLQHTGDVVTDVVAALTGMRDSYVAVQGPPGTGKTWTGARVIKRLVQQYHWRIGVVAQSHPVVENLLAGLLAAGLEPELVGKSNPRADDPAWTVVPDKPKDRCQYLEDHRGTGCVLGGTAWTFAAQSLIEPGGLDLIVVDEAGQFSLAPTVGVSIASERLLLLGDPQQLPQVSQGTHAEPVDASALGWLMHGHDTVPAELGFFLGSSFRMHPALCRRVSTLSYEGQLSSDAGATGRSLQGVEPGLRVVEVEHEFCRTFSEEEAAEVLRQVRGMVGTPWTDPRHPGGSRPLVAADFLVVAPYNAQVNLVRRTLEDAGLSGVRVGTVDKFQGQEAPVTILSMTASSHGDVPRGMGFLLSRNRINVAVSRAQWLTVLIRSNSLTSFMPRSTQGLLELGAFIGLCAPDQSGP